MPAFVVNLSPHAIIGIDLLAQMDQNITGLTIGGVVMMTLSIGLVTALAAFCIHRILRK